VAFFLPQLVPPFEVIYVFLCDYVVKESQARQAPDEKKDFQKSQKEALLNRIEYLWRARVKTKS
jgi:hypothetical protein